MLVNLEVLQRSPFEAINKSYTRPQHITIFLFNGFMRYVMVCGVSQYQGTVDYSTDVVLQ